MSSANNSCAFCMQKSPRYSCPKCNAPYCTLKCYRSPEHVECAEKFYKDCVKEELSSASNAADGDAKRRMIESLRRLNQEEDGNEEEEEGEDGDGVDSDDDADLAERLAGVDLDDADSVWRRMTKEERGEFEKLVSSGDIGKLVPGHQAWWEEEEAASAGQQQSKMVQVVGEEEEEPKIDPYLSRCPPTELNIPSLRTVMASAEPSPLLKFGLLNVLYAYAYGVKYFNGSHLDLPQLTAFVQLVLSLSANLGPAKTNFDCADAALEDAASASLGGGGEWTVSPQFSRAVKKDVYLLVKGPARGGKKDLFLFAALSDLKRSFKKCLKEAKVSGKAQKKIVRFDELKEDLPPWKRDGGADLVDLSLVKKALKKVEFYMSWLLDFPHEYDLLR